MTPGDTAFEKEMKSLLFEYCSGSNSPSNNFLPEVDVTELLSSFPEAQLLTIYASPLLIEYFSENVQLLYLLDSIKP